MVGEWLLTHMEGRIFMEISLWVSFRTCCFYFGEIGLKQLDFLILIPEIPIRQNIWNDYTALHAFCKKKNKSLYLFTKSLFVGIFRVSFLLVIVWTLLLLYTIVNPIPNPTFNPIPNPGPILGLRSAANICFSKGMLWTYDLLHLSSSPQSPGRCGSPRVEAPSSFHVCFCAATYFIMVRISSTYRKPSLACGEHHIFPTFVMVGSQREVQQVCQLLSSVSNIATKIFAKSAVVHLDHVTKGLKIRCGISRWVRCMTTSNSAIWLKGTCGAMEALVVMGTSARYQLSVTLANTWHEHRNTVPNISKYLCEWDPLLPVTVKRRNA